MSKSPTIPGPHFVQVRALSQALSLHPQTLRAYIRDGVLDGVQVQRGPRLGIDAPRKTGRGRWLVDLQSVEKMLSRLYQGHEVPIGLLRRLRRRGRLLNDQDA